MIELFFTLCRRIKTWKDLFLTLCLFIIVVISSLIIDGRATNLINTSRKEITKEIVSQYDSLVNRTIQVSPEINLLINNKLDELNKNLGFNRSLVVVYHNNITMANGVPYLRMSISHERINEVKYKVKSEITLFQNIPSSIFDYLNDELMQSSTVIHDLNYMKSVNLARYNIFIESNIKGYIASLMRDKKGTIIGILVNYKYDDDIKIDDITMNYIKIYNNSIADLLNY